VDFGWTEEQERLRDDIVAFARRELNHDVARRDAEGAFAPDAWLACARFGIQGLPVPAEYGGRGLDPLTLVLALEALGYGCTDNGLLFALGAQMWSVEMPLVRFGSEDQKRRYLPGLCDGSLTGVHAMSEPGSGSDAFSLTTTAEKHGAGYVLTGHKTYITNAPEADLVLVFATEAPGSGFAGVSAFLVDREAPGLAVGQPFPKMGLRTVQMSEVTFDGCEVPATSMLGKPGGGLAIFNHSMDWERSYILAGAVGTMQRQLEACLAYARARRQFGQPIGQFQAVSHRVVDMALRLRTARLLLYELGWLRSQGRRTTMDSALAKLCVSESFLQSSLDALFVHGAAGYLADREFERDVRDAVAGCIYSGTSDIQRNIVASRLGL
jgi:alkylation response protein AidB-like acyl-CoA dehydrogenase